MYQFIEKAVSDCVAWLAGLDFYCSYNLEHLFNDRFYLSFFVATRGFRDSGFDFY